MTVTFRPAVREQVGLWINLIGGTGSGKTWTGLTLASGIAGDKKFAFVDTENRRGLHYADQFNFDYTEIIPPFRPEKFAEAVLAADAADYPVIVIDSGSMVWAGDGGILDWQIEEVDRMAGQDWQKRERVKMSSWIAPKMAHKKMVQKFLQVKAHIILCLRAEEKIEMVKGANGKVEIRAKQTLTGLDGWVPICSKELPFEATASFLLTADKPGMPHPIKLQEQHKAIFPLDRPISAESGRLLAQWAAGGKAKKEDDLPKRRASVIEYFGKMGVTIEQIAQTANVLSVDEIGEPELMKLKEIANSIKGGLSVEDAFASNPEPSTSDLEPDTSEVTTDGEDETVKKQLLHELEEKVFQVGELQLSNGQRKRYGNRANLKTEDLQALIDELSK